MWSAIWITSFSLRQIESADIDAYYQKDLPPDLQKESARAQPRRVKPDSRASYPAGYQRLDVKWLDETKSR